ncbi:putative bifunctional cbb3-type cytochrome c oxidase subunit II/cytochrome c [Ruegeria denitrificans]|uniref:Putative bifunctional cbb3-type cytochrome c oxidase subunit II/cytochrome c n=1 Tax=Ruegeria denitrificans TaxID=1715692 RepID=A0A0P1ILD6_9RHOB|nr:cytochrome c [Ruegeria denitrificans]CUK10317.1 putative bifunctional cbb3-type cytochrome c oxidase subunit II/cytochrome c [Ruegeria denitrificans]
MSKHLRALAICSIGTSVAADHELTDRDLANGQELYAVHCASCHGVDLEGQPNWQAPDDDGVLPAPPHDVTGHTWHHDNQLLFEYTKLGGADTLEARGIKDFNSGMPGFKGILTNEEIWDVLAYIRSTWPDDVQQMQASRNPPHQ